MAVIPPKAKRTRRIPCDTVMFRWRRLIKNFFCKFKAFRRIGTRCEKTGRSFAAMIHLVGSEIALRSNLRRLEAKRLQNSPYS